MTDAEIFAAIQQVFRRVFENPQLVIGPATTAKDIQGWDSLDHTLLLAEVQAHFEIKLALKEIMRLQNVGDLCAAVGRKVAS